MGIIILWHVSADACLCKEYILKIIIPMKDDAPNIEKKRDASLVRVTCPYCLVGYSDVVVDITEGGSVKQVIDMDIPRRCEACKRLFKLTSFTKIYGKKLEEP